jgi:hypothetical protein
MKALKIILLLILAIFIISVARKVIIISDLQNKASKYTDITNFHEKSYHYQQDKYVKNEMFCLDNKQLIITTSIIDEEKTVRKIYSDGNTVNIYTETEGKKTAKLNQKMKVIINVNNVLYTESWLHLLTTSIPATINTKEYNGKDYYYIVSANQSLCENGVYIDKETGLAVRINSSTTKNMTEGSDFMPAIDYAYEFNTVTKDVFIEPDINEYEIEE